MNGQLHLGMKILNAHAQAIEPEPPQGLEMRFRGDARVDFDADLGVLREFCAARADDKSRAAAEALRALPSLPPRGTLAQFLEQTHAALAYLGWKQQALDLASVAYDWSQRLEAKFPRALFLRWLAETAVASDAARSAAGDHPYARIQLLTVAGAQNQEWSHLIFAGWNEGAWPPPAGAEFARTEEIYKLAGAERKLAIK